MLRCDEPGCAMPVTHVLVTYRHDPIHSDDPRALYGNFFCTRHAFNDGRECCHICERYPDQETKTEDPLTGDVVKLKRTYASGELDADDMCSDHP